MKKYLIILIIAVSAVSFLAGNYFRPFAFSYQKSSAGWFGPNSRFDASQQSIGPGSVTGSNDRVQRK